MAQEKIPGDLARRRRFGFRGRGSREQVWQTLDDELTADHEPDHETASQQAVTEPITPAAAPEEPEAKEWEPQPEPELTPATPEVSEPAQEAGAALDEPAPEPEPEPEPELTPAVPESAPTPNRFSESPSEAKTVSIPVTSLPASALAGSPTEPEPVDPVAPAAVAGGNRFSAPSEADTVTIPRSALPPVSEDPVPGDPVPAEDPVDPDPVDPDPVDPAPAADDSATEDDEVVAEVADLPVSEATAPALPAGPSPLRSVGPVSTVPAGSAPHSLAYVHNGTPSPPTQPLRLHPTPANPTPPNGHAGQVTEKPQPSPRATPAAIAPTDGPKKRRWWPWIALVIVALLAIAAVVGVLIGRSGPSEPPAPTTSELVRNAVVDYTDAVATGDLPAARAVTCGRERAYLDSVNPARYARIHRQAVADKQILTIDRLTAISVVDPNNAQVQASTYLSGQPNRKLEFLFTLQRSPAGQWQVCQHE